MNESAVTHGSAADIAAAVRSRAVRASDVVRACLDRIERLEPRYNTFVTVTAEAALAAAQRVDALVAAGIDPGPLAGVPISVKDLIAVKDVRQTFGSQLLAQNMARNDAPSVERLRAAGACIVGKSTTSELGSKAVGDSPLTGITRNPWNPDHTPGGSSSGAAAAVAAGMVPVALGTDGGGSIRIPASFCGLFGIKARYGRVPVWPPAATPALAHVGPITRTVRDAALLLADNVAQHDAPAVERLRAAGACIVGKSTTSELGSKGVGDSPLTGITRNPWDPARTPGGSSSGAAAGVAAGIVPVALATDGGGSIRIPASFCGLFGIKARFGRVPVWPPAATPMLAHVGPITRTVRDAALMLSVIAGHDPRDPNAVQAPVPDFGGSLNAGVAGLRIGWCPSFGYGRADAQVLARCAEAALALAAHGAQVEELPPPFARDPAPAWNHMFYGRIAQRLAELAPTPERMALVNPALRAAVAHEQSPAALDDAQAGALRAQALAEAEALFRRVDVLLTPTLPVTALRVEVDVPPGHAGRNAVDWSWFTYPFNLTGHPAASFPVGNVEGLPVGLQVVAGLDGERTILRVAAVLEQLYPVRLPRV